MLGLLSKHSLTPLQTQLPFMTEFREILPEHNLSQIHNLKLKL